jgi:integrase
MGSLLLRGKTWWACYYVNGTEHRESSRQLAEGFRDGSLADAKRLLRKRVAEIQSQQFVAPDAKRLTFEDLRDGALSDYTRKGLRSGATAAYRFQNLAEFFGGQRVLHITTARLIAYQDSRRADGAANGTINRELIALHRAFVLARKANRLNAAMIPEFPDRLEESMPRQGFLEHGTFLAVYSHLPADHGDVFEFAYYSGWRRREIHSLPWRMVDLNANVLRLDPTFSKTKKGRCCQFRHRSGRCSIGGSPSGASTVNWSSTWMGGPWAIGAKRGRGHA